MRFKINAIFFQNDLIAKALKVFVISFFKIFAATNKYITIA